MKKAILTTLKFAVLAALGVWIVYKLWTGMTVQEQADLFLSFKTADYLWIIISMVCAILSHLSRAARWNLMLNSMGYQPKLKNSFFAVMGGYLVNMIIPRGGEAARAGVLTRSEDVPFKHTIGTILGERALDFIILMTITGTAFLFNFQMLNENLLRPVMAKFTTNGIIILCLVGVVGVVGMYFVITKTAFGGKIKGFLVGLLDGLKSIFLLKKRWLFLAHTAFIWLMYGVMFYVCFFAFAATASVSGSSMLTGFVLGSFAILVIPGGIGAYPAAIQLALAKDLPEGSVLGFSLGWIVWSSQTALNIVLGGLSLILVKRKTKVTAEDESSDTPEIKS